MSKTIENSTYKKVILKTLRNDKKSFCPFRKEKQMDYLFSELKKDFRKKHLKIFEAGCGYGRLIYFLNEFDSNQEYFGADYVGQLIREGKRSFSNNKNITLFHLDVFKLPNSFRKLFDISISYKTLSWFPGYEEFIKQIVKVTKKKIYITSLFYDGDIDFITKIYVNAQDNDKNFSYLNTYSFPKFKKFCRSVGIKKVRAIDMHVDFDIKRPKDMNVLQTYTVSLSRGERLEITGNTILNWKLIELTL